MADVWIKTFWIYGLAVVVSLLIALVIKFIVLAVEWLERAPAAESRPLSATPEPAVGPPPEHVAVIAAAVCALLGCRRIVHIEESRQRAGWLAEGRHAQHVSHGIEHHPKH
jgi:hypothetical protein